MSPHQLSEVESIAANTAANFHPQGNADELMKPGETAQLLGVPVSWVYANGRRLPGYLKVGRYVRFRRRVFLHFLHGDGCE
jgi:hypothetical protein